MLDLSAVPGSVDRPFREADDVTKRREIHVALSDGKTYLLAGFVERTEMTGKVWRLRLHTAHGLEDGPALTAGIREELLAVGAAVPTLPDPPVDRTFELAVE